MSAHPDQATLQAGVRRVQDEAAGLVDVVVVRKIDALEMLVASMSGDDEATALLRATEQTIAIITDAPRRSPKLCTSCPRPLKRSNYAVVLAIPARSAPAHALGLAVCERCATDVAGIKAKALAGMRKIWPDLRAIDVTHPEGGRA